MSSSSSLSSPPSSPSSSSSSSSPPAKFPKMWPSIHTKSRTRSSWTEGEELRLLQAALEVKNMDENTSNEFSSFFDHIFASLHRDFTKDQVVDKLKGIKRRFQSRNSDPTTSTPHNIKLFEICEKIWNENAQAGTSNSQKGNEKAGDIGSSSCGNGSGEGGADCR